MPELDEKAKAWWQFACYLQCLGLTEDQMHRISLILAEPKAEKDQPLSQETWRGRGPLL